MTQRAHIAFLVFAGLGMIAGAYLWSRWGALVWISDFIAWCG